MYVCLWMSESLCLFLWMNSAPLSLPPRNIFWSSTITAISLSLRFNDHFPGEPGLAGVYWSKGWWRWWWQLDYCSYKSCKAAVKSSAPTNQHPVFLQAGCPSCRPTNSVKALNGKYHIRRTSSLGVFQLCPWPLISPGYLGGRLPCLSSALRCQYTMNDHRNACSI